MKEENIDLTWDGTKIVDKRGACFDSWKPRKWVTPSKRPTSPSQPSKTWLIQYQSTSVVSTPARTRPSNTYRPRTLPPLLLPHIATQIVLHLRPIRILQIHTLQRNISTRRHSTTLQAHRPTIFRRALYAINFNIANLKLAVRAISLPRRTNKPRALTNTKRRTSHALRC